MTGEETSMAGDHAGPERCRAEAAELAWDLSRVQGALEEIATCWRRLLSRMPELPLRLPLDLADAARAIGADVVRLVDAGTGQSPGLAVEGAGRFAAFRRDMAAARALTGALDPAETGDALLWESADRALHCAGSHLLCLILRLVTDADWFLTDFRVRVPAPAPAPGRGRGQARLTGTARVAAQPPSGVAP